jgi:ribosomal protein L7/L12
MWTTVVILLFAIPGAVFAALLLGRMAAGGRARRRDLTAFRPPAVTFTPDVESRVRDLIARGRKIEAIKVVREHTGLGLKDAKDLVEAMQAGHPVAVSERPGQAPPRRSGLVEAVPPATRARATELVARDAMIQAIKLVREETGLGLKDAKDYCDALRAGRLPPARPLSDRARALISEGDRAAAVALVRAETGMTQSEAEAFADALD